MQFAKLNFFTTKREMWHCYVLSLKSVTANDKHTCMQIKVYFRVNMKFLIGSLEQTDYDIQSKTSQKVFKDIVYLL